MPKFGAGSQFWALMRKNWIVKKRSWVSTTFEILLPTIVLAVLVLIHTFSASMSFEADLHLGNETLTFNTGNFTAFLINRLNVSRTGIGIMPRQDFPEMETFFRTFVEPTINTQRQLFPNLPDQILYTFDTKKDLTKYLEDSNYGRIDEKPQLTAIVQGKELYTNQELPPIPHFEYHIRMNASGSVETPSQQTVPDTRIAPIDIIQPGFEAEQWTKYAIDGFYFLQQLQDLFILNRTGAVYIKPFDQGGVFDLDQILQYKLIPFPTKAFSQDSFFRSVGETIGLFFTITFIWSVTRIVASLIEEKELKLREGMKIMGLESKWLILSWIGTYLIIFFLTSLSITAFVCPFLFGASNYLILFTFFFSFCLSTFSFGYLMSTIFNKSNVGSAFSAIIFLVIYFANEVVKTPGTARGSKLLCSLSPAVALAQGAATFGQYEQAHTGITFARLFEQYDGYSVGDAIVLLLFDTLWLFLLGSYLERVLPGEYGISEKWYFPCVCCFQKKKKNISLLEDGIYDTLPPNEPYTKVQPPAQNDIGNEGVKIRKLRKTFQRDKKEPFIAVHELSLDMYKNHVTVLLGHNGAGKSTTINMLTGLIGTTSGNVQILGHELDTDLDQIRKVMGYCPQHDLLYPTLSVREHLELYADLKGATTDETLREQMILDMIEEVGLAKDNKEHALSMTLSGGQKRKLSVAIALLNNSPIVLLDEPSSGMDVAAQRDLWKLIQNAKKNRVILLTTHSMEEAEIGDRIAILAHSRLQCIGTSHFLKNAYGVGYTLTITKKASGQSSDTTQQSNEPYKMHPDCTTRTGSAIASYLLPKYPFLSISSDAGMEIGFKVKFEESHQFPKLFDDLEASRDKLSIVAYGMSVTTLTEVFLTVGHGQEFIEGVHDRKQLTEIDDEVSKQTNNDHDLNSSSTFGSSSQTIDYSTSAIDSDMLGLLGAQSSVNNNTGRNTNTNNIHTDGELNLPDKDKYSLEDIYGSARSRQDMILTGKDLFQTHFKAMFRKRLANSKRDVKTWVWQLLFPSILLITSLLMVKLTNVDEYPTRIISPSLYFNEYDGFTPIALADNVNADPFINQLTYSTPIKVDTSTLPPPLPPQPDPKKLQSIQMIQGTHINQFTMQSLINDEYELVSDASIIDIWGQFKFLNQLFINAYIDALNPSGPTSSYQQQRDYEQLYQYELNTQINNEMKKSQLLQDENNTFNTYSNEELIDLMHLQPTTTTTTVNKPTIIDFDQFGNMINYYQDYLHHIETKQQQIQQDDDTTTTTPIELPHINSIIAPITTPHQNGIENENNNNNEQLTDGMTLIPLDRFQTWLLNTFDDGQYRFIAYTINKYNVNPTITNNVVFNGTLHFNTTARDSLPSAVNSFSNAILRAHYIHTHPTITKDGKKDEETEEDKKFKSLPTITVYNNPLPRTEQEKLFVSSTVGIFIALSMAFVPSTFVGFLVKERAEKAKHLQIISGVSPIAYWVSTYAWDTLNFIFPFIMSMIILKIYNMEALLKWEVLPLTILSFWLFQLSVAPFAYCFSFLFDSHNAAQNLTLLLGFFLSVILLIASLIMSKLPSTMKYDQVLRWVYRLFPPFSFGESLITITFRNSGFNPEPIYRPLSVMGCSSILYFGLLLLLESWSNDHQFQTWGRKLKTFFMHKLPCCRPKTISRGGVIMSNTNGGLVDEEDIPIDNIENEEQDVVDERNRILYGECDNNQYGVVLKGLRKVYSSRAGQPPHVAVNNLYFAVPFGQCFGMLGANGAGKSTTMKLITGDEIPSPNSGTATLGGFDLLTQSSRVRQVLGYCPQFDALLPLLTAREHLELYARIKCVPEKYISGLVNYMIDKLGLTHLQNNPAGSYSGGNKRKLSIGIALIGQPLALLLDEPSSGVDPGSRREIWRLISSTMKGRAVILVSHSMEECEALCHRIGIMTSGNLRAINSAQNLKTKYGDGYQVITKSKDGLEQTLLDFFMSTYRGVEVVEQHGVNFTLKVPKVQNDKPLGFKDIFTVIENNKTSAGIESYSVSDTDLEHIFIGFVEEDNRKKRERRKLIEYAQTHPNAPLTDISFLGSPGNEGI